MTTNLETDSPIPKKLGGKEFEELLLEYTEREKDRMTMGRYGVQVSFVHGEWKPIQSLPDFDGVLRGGRQFISEAKVESGASFSLKDDHFRDRQYKHMKKRASYGVPCYLIIHFNERVLVTKTVPAITIRVDVDPESDLWKGYEAGTIRSISPELALKYGTEVQWTCPKGKRKFLPAFL